MMVKFFGRSTLKQFIKTKPVRFGIKLWAICTFSGYMLDFDIYGGKESKNNNKKLSACALGSKVVIQMLNSLLLTVPRTKLYQYHIYFDNLFTSPDLVLHLIKNGLRSTGVIRKDRIKEQHTFDKGASRGEYKVKYDKNSGINYISMIDSKQVSFLSTAAGVTPITNMKRYSKSENNKVDCGFPHAAIVYNKYMGGVDIHDYKCNRVILSIRAEKGTWPMFLRIIQSSIVNANILWNLCNEKSNKETLSGVPRRF